MVDDVCISGRTPVMTGASALRRAWMPLVVTGVLIGLGFGCASTPAYLNMGPEELWEAGVQAFEEEEWSEAIQFLERLVLQNPGNPRNPQAQVYVARAYEERGELITAAAEYERFLNTYRGDGLAPEASLGICKAYAALAPHPQRDQTYTRRAREACEETWLAFRGLNVAEVADSLRVEMVELLAERAFQEAEFYRSFVPVSAPGVYEIVVTEYPETEWAPRALLAIYRHYDSIGWGPEAEEASDRLFAEYPDSDPARELRAELSGGGGAGTLGAEIDR